MFTPRMTSQRRAPLISAPKYGVSAVSTKLTANATSATLRISCGDRKEDAISTSAPTAASVRRSTVRHHSLSTVGCAREAIVKLGPPEDPRLRPDPEKGCP